MVESFELTAQEQQIEIIKAMHNRMGQMDRGQQIQYVEIMKNKLTPADPMMKHPFDLSQYNEEQLEELRQSQVDMTEPLLNELNESTQEEAAPEQFQAYQGAEPYEGETVMYSPEELAQMQYQNQQIAEAQAYDQDQLENQSYQEEATPEEIEAASQGQVTYTSEQLAQIKQDLLEIQAYEQEQAELGNTAEPQLEELVMPGEWNQVLNEQVTPEQMYQDYQEIQAQQEQAQAEEVGPFEYTPQELAQIQQEADQLELQAYEQMQAQEEAPVEYTPEALAQIQSDLLELQAYEQEFGELPTEQEVMGESFVPEVGVPFEADTQDAAQMEMYNKILQQQQFQQQLDASQFQNAEPEQVGLPGELPPGYKILSAEEWNQAQEVRQAQEQQLAEDQAFVSSEEYLSMAGLEQRQQASEDYLSNAGLQQPNELTQLEQAQMQQLLEDEAFRNTEEFKSVPSEAQMDQLIQDEAYRNSEEYQNMAGFQPQQTALDETLEKMRNAQVAEAIGRHETTVQYMLDNGLIRPDEINKISPELLAKTEAILAQDHEKTVQYMLENGLIQPDEVNKLTPELLAKTEAILAQDTTYGFANQSPGSLAIGAIGASASSALSGWETFIMVPLACVLIYFFAKFIKKQLDSLKNGKGESNPLYDKMDGDNL